MRGCRCDVVDKVDHALRRSKMHDAACESCNPLLQHLLMHTVLQIMREEASAAGACRTHPTVCTIRRTGNRTG